MNPNLLIIGGGIAGAMAAITAAEAGVKAIVVRRGYGSSAMSGGVIELASVRKWGRQVLGYREEDTAEWAGPAIDLFKTVMAEASNPYSGDLTDWVWLANTLGTVRKAQIAPQSMVEGDLSLLPDAKILVVGVRGYPDFQAEYVSQSLTHFSQANIIPARFTASSCLIDIPEIKHTANISPFDIAQMMDDAAFHEAFFARAGDAADLREFTHIAFPPILGWQRPDAAAAAAARLLGKPCFELVCAPPSVPGMRLQRALDQAMEKRGVTIIRGKVEGSTAERGRIHTVRARDKDHIYEWEPAEVILASGKFISGGITRNGRLRETIFDLPLFIDGRQETDAGMTSLISEEFTSRQRIFAAGVKVDSAFRPVSSNGDVLYDNLRAVGAVTEGYEFTHRSGGLGLALVSGALCGAAVVAEGVKA